MSTRVIKLGGSLLELPGLAERLRRWLVTQSAASNVLVVGGGQVANAVRAFDCQHGLHAADAHWFAVGAMELNARMMAGLLPEAVWLEWPNDRLPLPPSVVILNPTRLLEQDELAQAAGRLPMNWQVTSDSIAARTAELLDADELVLLKSADPTEPATVETLVAAGYVDAFFGEASRNLRGIRYVNFRTAVCTGGAPPSVLPGWSGD